MAIVAEVKNHDLLAKSIEKLVDHANQTTRGMPMQSNGTQSRRDCATQERGKRLLLVDPQDGNSDRRRLRPTLLLGPEDARSRLHSRHGAKGARSGGEPVRGGAAVRQSTDEQARLASRQLDVAQRRRYGAVGLSRAHRGIAQAARIHDRRPDGLPIHDADEFRSKGWRAGTAGSGCQRARSKHSTSS